MKIWKLTLLLVIAIIAALLVIFRPMTTAPKASSLPQSPKIQYIVDSLRVRSLADSLAKLQGDSLRAFWKRYWLAIPVPVAYQVVKDSSGRVDTVESSDTILDTSFSQAARNSILVYEQCKICLDSNRSEVKILQKAYLSCEDSLHLPPKIPWKEIGVSSGAGLITGYILGKIF